MDSVDYIADLEGEVRVLHDRVTELEDELRQVRDELTAARERKVEETDEGVPKEEIIHQNRVKKEETPVPEVRAGKHERKTNATPKLQGDDDPDVPIITDQRQPQRQGKRKGPETVDQRSPRPKKQPTFWVEPPLRRVPPTSAALQSPSPGGSTQAVITTPAVKNKPDIQEIANTLAMIRKPVIKKDEKALDDVSVFSRLSKIGLEIFPITIEAEIKDLGLRSIFAFQCYGDISVGTFPTIRGEKVRGHGDNNFMNMTMIAQPNAPSIPGAPGIWIDFRNSGFSENDTRLIVRAETKPSAPFQYMGQYDIRPSDPLSLQEWTSQSEQTKEGWITLCWRGIVRARIKFRKLKGREPTRDERKKLVIPSVEEVTREEVRLAFDKGEERLYTWTLKCRGYDERFQKKIWDADSKQRSKPRRKPPLCY